MDSLPDEITEIILENTLKKWMRISAVSRKFQMLSFRAAAEKTSDVLDYCLINKKFACAHKLLNSSKIVKFNKNILYLCDIDAFRFVKTHRRLSVFLDEEFYTNAILHNRLDLVDGNLTRNLFKLNFDRFCQIGGSVLEHFKSSLFKPKLDLNNEETKKKIKGTEIKYGCAESEYWAEYLFRSKIYPFQTDLLSENSNRGYLGYYTRCKFAPVSNDILIDIMNNILNFRNCVEFGTSICAALESLKNPTPAQISKLEIPHVWLSNALLCDARFTSTIIKSELSRETRQDKSLLFNLCIHKIAVSDDQILKIIKYDFTLLSSQLRFFIEDAPFVFQLYPVMLKSLIKNMILEHLSHYHKNELLCRYVLILLKSV